MIQRRTLIKKGYYPILKSRIYQLMDYWEVWGGNNKTICKCIAEKIIEDITLYYPDIPIRKSLYSDLVSVIHNINSGRIIEDIKLELNG